MGVPGLWDIVNPSGQARSLTHLAVVDGFEANPSGRRAFRVGIDASIWYNHASSSTGGENPQLRLLFFRVRTLAEMPLLPLFVFDGRERPKVKRGSKMGKSGSHGLTAGMKKLLDIFGMEWRMALGEAEAELAHLNRTGVIDAIMTDDVDTLVFGARMIIKNPSLALSGNKSKPALNLEGKASKYHVMVYTAEAARVHPEVGLTRGGFILFALLAGGDYDDGVNKFGKQIAHGLARCGFGDQLLTAFERRTYLPMQPFLIQWRAAVNTELRTNSQGFLPHKCPSLTLPNTFPDTKIMENYACPVTSASAGRQGGGQLRDNADLNLARIAGFCEDHFGEWGYESIIIKRFRDLLWEACVIRVLRRAALEVDEKEKNKRIGRGEEWSTVHGPLTPTGAETVGTSASIVKKYLSMAEVDRRREGFVNRGPAPRQDASGSGCKSNLDPLIIKIVGRREHVSTDNLLEYRVEVKPSQLIALTRSGIKGKRSGPVGGRDDGTDIFDAILASGAAFPSKSPKKPAPEPESIMRMWVAASIMRQVHPDLVEDFEAAEQAKRDKKDGRNKKGRRSAVGRNSDDESGQDGSPKPKRKRTTKRSRNDAGQSQGEGIPGSSVAKKRRRNSIPAGSLTSSGAASAEPSPLSRNSSGFLFSFSDPDDPNMLVDEGSSDEENDVLDRFDLLFDQIMDPKDSDPTKLSAQQASESMGSVPLQLARPQSRPKARKNKNPVKSSAANQFEPFPSQAGVMSDMDDSEDDGLDPFNIMFAQIMGGKASEKTTNASAGRRRARASAAGVQIPPPAISTRAGSSNNRNAKRRKTVHANEPRQSSFSPFPQLLPVGTDIEAPIRPSTSTAVNSDIIEIFSDSELPVPPESTPYQISTRKPKLNITGKRCYRIPSSSQDSSLLEEDEVDIDLT